MILSIDPGGKSGLAIRMDDGSIQTCICESLFNKDKKLIYNATELYEFLSMEGIHHIIYENFQAQTIDKYGLHTVRLVGAIEAMCWYRKIPFTRHMPQMRYPFMEEAKEILQGFKRKYLVHEVDALAHLLRYENDVRTK